MKLQKMCLMLSIMISLFLFANGLQALKYIGEMKPAPQTQPRDISMPLSQAEELREMPHTDQADSSVSGGKPVNLLVLGLDEEEVRTDVILLFNYSPEKGRLNILSIPRDTRVYARGRYSKINALYSAGRESLVASEVRQITGLSVHYYITMNFKGFRKIIDELGGVRYTVPFRMDYDDPDQNLHIHLRKGTQVLDGAKAEQLVRYRKGNDPDEGYINGDIGRIAMQQDFIKSLISQKLNFRYVSKIDDIFGILSKYMSTNIGLAELSYYLGGVMRIKSDEVKNLSIPGESVIRGDIWYYIHDRGRTEDMIRDNFYK